MKQQQNDVMAFRGYVNKEIAKNGINVTAISKSCDCEQCKAEGIVKTGPYDDIFDGYVFSTGFHRKGLPEVLILCGSNGIEEGSLTKEQLEERIQSAYSFIMHIYNTQGKFEFNPRGAINSNIKDLWWVIAEEDSLDMEFIKHDLMQSTTAYYDTCEYNIIVYQPHIYSVEVEN